MRDIFVGGLRDLGWKFTEPEGSYFMMVDISEFQKGMTDIEFCEKLAYKVGVAAVPGSSFFKEDVNNLARFHFAKKDETLYEALERLSKMKDLM